MNKRKVKYRSTWESQFDWVKKDKDENCAFCKVCLLSFRIDNSGVSQVKAHGKTSSHNENERLKAGKTSQRVLCSNSNAAIALSAHSLTFSPSEQVVNAETLQALDIVQSNYSFASSNSDNDKFRRMFPDSAIAKSYQQAESKTKYVIQFGIAPHIRKLMIEDFNGQPFTFKFDETTTAQVKKQYDGYVQFWSKSKNMVVNRFDINSF